MAWELILPFGLENLLIGFLLKKSLAFWVKKSPLWSGQKSGGFYIMKDNIMLFRRNVMKRKKVSTGHAKVITSFFIVLVIAITFFIFDPLFSINRFVKNNYSELMEYAESMVQAGNNGECAIYGNFEVTYWADSNMVEFIVRKKGLGSSSSYEGFYYSPDNQLLAFQGNLVDFVPYKSGWIWEENDGDNHEYIEKIMDNWYRFEIYF